VVIVTQFITQLVTVLPEGPPELIAKPYFWVGAGYHRRAHRSAKSATNKRELGEFRRTDAPDRVCDRAVVYHLTTR
jgi:hypothetical protein